MEGGRLHGEGDLSQAEIARSLGIGRNAVSQWAWQIKQRCRGLHALDDVNDSHKIHQNSNGWVGG